MEILIVFAVSILAGAVKKWVLPRFGATGVHVLVFALGLIGAVGYNLYQSDPAFQTIVSEALRTLAFAIALYEVILKRLGLFQVK